jgi:hypothetical protein
MRTVKHQLKGLHRSRVLECCNMRQCQAEPTPKMAQTIPLIRLSEAKQGVNIAEIHR